jgi:hypothetical protein
VNEHSSLNYFTKVIIIIHLLGLAPAGYMTTPDNGPEAWLRVGASQGDGCRAVPLNLLNLPVGRNLRRGKDYELRFWKGDYWPHTYPFALSRPPVGSLQLCSPRLDSSLSVVDSFGVTLSG